MQSQVQPNDHKSGRRSDAAKQELETTERRLEPRRVSLADRSKYLVNLKCCETVLPRGPWISILRSAQRLEQLFSREPANGSETLTSREISTTLADPIRVPLKIANARS
jgi:hypothetical protein